MSTISGPVLEKRKSIDPCRYDHFSAKEEAILVPLGEKKDSTLGEKEKEKEGVGEKDCAIGRLLKIVEELNKKVLQEELKSNPGFTGFTGAPMYLGGKCQICESTEHYTCPWEMGAYSDAVPKVTSYYRVLCKRCGNTGFEMKDSDDVQTCTNCGCGIMCAVRIRCPWCMKFGHLSKTDKECDFSRKEWTVDNDPILQHFQSLRSKK